MARKVYVSSDMAHDERLIEVAAESPEAALLWPWILTHFDDWGRAEANTLRMKAKLFPMNPLVTVDLLERTLALFASVGLIVLYEREGKRYMAIPSEKWYKYQTHIRRERRPGKDKLASDFPPPPDDVQEVGGDSALPQEPPRTPAGMRGESRFPVPSPSTLPPFKNHDDDARAREAWSGMEHWFGQAFGGTMNGSHYQEIDEWASQGLSLESVAEALRRAALQKARSWDYVRKICKRWIAQGLLTLEQVREDDERWEAERNHRSKGSSQARASPQRDNLSWIDAELAKLDQAAGGET